MYGESRGYVSWVGWILEGEYFGAGVLRVFNGYGRLVLGSRARIFFDREGEILASARVLKGHDLVDVGAFYDTLAPVEWAGEAFGQGVCFGDDVFEPCRALAFPEDLVVDEDGGLLAESSFSWRVCTVPSQAESLVFCSGSSGSATRIPASSSSVICSWSLRWGHTPGSPVPRLEPLRHNDGQDGLGQNGILVACMVTKACLVIAGNAQRIYPQISFPHRQQQSHSVRNRLEAVVQQTQQASLMSCFVPELLETSQMREARPRSIAHGQDSDTLQAP